MFMLSIYLCSVQITARTPSSTGRTCTKKVVRTRSGPAKNWFSKLLDPFDTLQPTYFPTNVVLASDNFFRFFFFYLFTFGENCRLVIYKRSLSIAADVIQASRCPTRGVSAAARGARNKTVNSNSIRGDALRRRNCAETRDPCNSNLPPAYNLDVPPSAPDWWKTIAWTRTMSGVRRDE